MGVELHLHHRHRLAGLVAGACAAALLGWSSVAFATNGYSPTGFGAKNKAMAGAGVALPQDAMAPGTNPAGLGVVERRLDAGLAIFMPDRGFTANDDGFAIPPGTYDSNNDVFLIPHFGYAHPIDEKTTIGFTLGGNGGMNSEYDATIWENFNLSPFPQFDATSPTRIDLAQLFIGVPLSYEVVDNHWLGIMPVLAYQRFEAKGLQPFGLFSVEPTDVSNRGYDDSVGGGVRVGWFSQLTDQLNFGVSYQTRLWMTRFTKYEGLFAEEGSFDIPATLIAGLAFEPIDNITLLFDYQRIFYGSVKALNNPNTVLPNPFTREFLLGADDGLGFGWQSINIYKFGIQWEFDPQWTFRAGYSHADQLFTGGDSLFNVMAPATIQDHAAFGGSYRIDDSNEVSLAVTRAFNNKIGGQSPFTGTQTGFVEMDQWEIELSWGFQF